MTSEVARAASVHRESPASRETNSPTSSRTASRTVSTQTIATRTFRPRSTPAANQPTTSPLSSIDSSANPSSLSWKPRWATETTWPASHAHDINHAELGNAWPRSPPATAPWSLTRAFWRGPWRGPREHAGPVRSTTPGRNSPDAWLCHDGAMTNTSPVETWLTDMDGVLVHEETPLPGAADFLDTLKKHDRPFLVLTNNSIYTPRDLRARLLRARIDVPESAIWTSALATAQFLDDQRPGGSAYVVGEAGLTTALHEVGYTMSDRDPDYVVLGETRTYSFEAITRAIRLIEGGARFIATNPDPSGPSPDGTLPATGSVAALISTATNRQPYYVGKPNSLMMRSALNQLEAHSETTMMIGDRMDTDIVSGLEAGLRTILVLSGSTPPDKVDAFPYQATKVLDSIADVVPLVAELDPHRG